MGKRNRVKARKKQKPKSKRRDRPARPTVLAYRGGKYRTAENVVWMHAAEVGIYEAFVMSGRRMVDRDVRKALEELVMRIRRGEPAIPLRTLESGHSRDNGHQSQVVQGEHDFLIWSIQRNWQYRAENMPSPGHDNLVGILRTVLGSMEVWSSRDPNSRGYLTYVGGFLAKTGVRIQEVSGDTEILPVGE